MRFLLLTMIAIAIAGAQPAAPPVGSVSGRFVDGDSGRAIPNYAPHAPDAYVQADAEGRFTMGKLQPGPQLLRLSGFPDFLTVWVTVKPGEDTGGLEVRVRQDGKLSGRVVDQSKDPVTGVRVCPILREYVGGVLYYYATGCATTDDRGQYSLSNVRSGRAFFLLAEVPRRDQVAISGAPAAPELRLPAYRPTYYGNADSVDGASPITLRSGEVRDHMDIQVLRSPQYCVEAVVSNGGAPASLMFRLTDELSSSSHMTPGSWGGATRLPMSGDDGKLRICDLYPGRFRLAAFNAVSARTSAGDVSFGAASFTVGKQDVRELRVSAMPASRLQGELVWEGTPPPNAAPPPFSLSLRLVTNDPPPPPNLRPDEQGSFAVDAWPVLDYYLDAFLRPSPLAAYVKSMSYAGVDVQHGWLRPSTASDERVRVIVANDGGTIQATATDRDGKPTGNAQFFLLPASANSEAVLSRSLVTGRSGASGQFTSPPLAPGKYYVLATYDLVDQTPESIAALWGARVQGNDVDVQPGASVSATVEVRAVLPKR